MGLGSSCRVLVRGSHGVITLGSDLTRDGSVASPVLLVAAQRFLSFLLQRLECVSRTYLLSVFAGSLHLSSLAIVTGASKDEGEGVVMLRRWNLWHFKLEILISVGLSVKGV